MKLKKYAEYLEKADYYYEEEQYFRSKECYSLVYQASPEFMDELSLLQYGLTLDALDDMREALKVFEFTIEAFPESFQAYYAKAMILEDMGRIEEALQFYLKAVELDDEYVEALFNIAGLYDDEKETELANIYYKKVLDIEPDNFWSLINFGSNLEAENKDQEALGLFQRALKVDKHPSALFNLGVIESKLNNTIKSIYYYEEANKLDDTNPYIYLNWSLEYKKMENYEKVVDLLSEGIDKCEHNSFLIYHRACAYGLMNKEEDMMEDFTKAYSMNKVFLEEARKDYELSKYMEKIESSILE